MTDPLPEPANAMRTGGCSLARPLVTVLSVGTASNRLLRFGLLMLAAIPTLLAAWRLLEWQIPGVDLLIPLLATMRWMHGGQPYVAASFAAVEGPGLPFLYPPFVLPFLVPLLRVPLDLTLVAAVGLCSGVAAWTLHRLGVPGRWMALFLVWPPFLEGIVSGNVGVIAFAAFAALFFAGPTKREMRLIPRDPTDRRLRGTPEGMKAAFVAALKTSQVHAWVYLLLHRRIAALAGLGALLALILVTLPITGLDLWTGWIQQLQRAADPAWVYGGNGLGRILPPVASLALAGASLIALRWVPRANAGVWVGLLSVVGGLSVHTYGLLFLLPAMLHVRREVALVGALFIGMLNPQGILIGSAVIIVGTAASIVFPALREPAPVLSTTVLSIEAPSLA